MDERLWEEQDNFESQYTNNPRNTNIFVKEVMGELSDTKEEIAQTNESLDEISNELKARKTKSSDKHLSDNLSLLEPWEPIDNADKHFVEWLETPNKSKDFIDSTYTYLQNLSPNLLSTSELEKRERALRERRDKLQEIVVDLRKRFTDDKDIKQKSRFDFLTRPDVKEIREKQRQEKGLPIPLKEKLINDKKETHTKEKNRSDIIKKLNQKRFQKNSGTQNRTIWNEKHNRKFKKRRNAF